MSNGYSNDRVRSVDKVSTLSTAARAPSSSDISVCRGIVKFLAETVIITDDLGRRCEAPPLCTDDEKKFLERIIKESERMPSPVDVDQLYGLFVRAGRSNYIDLRNAGFLHEILRVVSVSTAGTAESRRSNATSLPVPRVRQRSRADFSS
jgi:hypothetical protein